MSLSPDSPIADEKQRLQALILGVWLFLITLAMVFATTIVGYVVVRLQLVSANEWKPEGAPGLPWELFVSTLLLIASSGSTHAARSAVCRGASGRKAGGWMALTCALAAGFLFFQALAWSDLIRQELTFGDSLYAWLFFVLTGLHALHVLCGLPPLGIVTGRAFRGAYGPEPTSHAGLTFFAMYWHFLDAVWLVLYLVLLWGSRPG